MTFIYDFGQHKNKSIEQVAVIDFPYLLWSYNKVQRLSDDFKTHIKEVRFKLNNFVPDVKCGACKENIPEHISIGMNLPHGISVSTQYLYCDEKSCKSSALCYEKAQLYPLAFSTLEQLPHSPKWIREDVSEVLVQATGFRGRKTHTALESLLEHMELKRPLPQF